MRILVIGVSASGKTTFASRLAKKLDLPVTHMDTIQWNPGWQYVGDQAVLQKLTEISDQDSWIIEGYIVKAARIGLFDKADKILYLDYPGWLSAWRYLKRTLKHRSVPRPELPGSPEKFSWKFFKLVFTKGEVWKLEQLFKENDWDKKITRFKKPNEVKAYLINI